MTSLTGHPPAPLDPAAVAESLRPLRQARMLPRAAYVDPAVYAWEQRVFFSGWVCAGLSEDVKDPGDLRAEAVGQGGGVLLSRDDDGVLHAFANTCRHRGHELLPCGGAGHARAIVCPYHSWTYSLTGELRGAPGFRDRPGFAAGDWGLSPVRVTEWHGLVFVDGSGQAAPLTESLATLEPLVGPYEPERLVVAGRHGYETSANWKILTENYHECYHCATIHPQLCKVSPPDSGENYRAAGTWVGGRMALREGMTTMSLDGASHALTLRGLGEEDKTTVLYVNIFPNVLVSLHPDYVMVHRLTPLATDRTWIDCTWAFAPESLAEPGFDPDYAIKFWDVTNRQDWHACESVQRGLSSPHAAPGPLSDREDAVHHFVAMVARGYLGEPVWNLGQTGGPAST
ncbi:MAG TPA: aromatic ring-hydroxylating dioxygenase subunit alpha [Streptosporangiaceae bacterium]|nr:aromatic ring-hydroxylating dioxygenase subunit alpha [Streptosporangiaceae bacterium]